MPRMLASIMASGEACECARPHSMCWACCKRVCWALSRVDFCLCFLCVQVYVAKSLPVFPYPFRPSLSGRSNIFLFFERVSRASPCTFFWCSVRPNSLSHVSLSLSDCFSCGNMS